jgi:hypothetical protein
VLTVLAAGLGGDIDINDLTRKKGSSLKQKADTATSYNDLMVEVAAPFFALLALGICNSLSKDSIHPCSSWISED